MDSVDAVCTLDGGLLDDPAYKSLQEKNTKLALLKDLLENDLEDEPVVVYSPFATSITHLFHALKAYSPVVITGAVSTVERDAARHAFQDGKTQLILITDAGGNIAPFEHFILRIDYAS